MRNIIPNFIHSRFKEGELSGRFNAAAMFVDIAGFTALTGEFMHRGKEGAELKGKMRLGGYKAAPGA